MKKHALAALALLVFSCHPALAAQLQGRVVGVSDGDTITLLTGERRQYKIRLSGIDAPEKKQAFGNVAKQTLSRQVFGRPVVVEWSKTDRYGRIVGRIEVDGADVNLEQVREGSAWVYTQYLKELPAQDRKRYLDAEQQAKEERRGLWRDSDPEPPWQWRRERRNGRDG
ncbi:MAG TPA: thermonuclease family protein [Burkholderiales bacterium]|jgi:endonuclease YncB( thermonuclease family)|nr:thermonuclease family protein [Burkholderiales bacterium]